MTNEQRELLEGRVRVLTITSHDTLAIAVRACLAQLDSAERVVEAAREYRADNDDGHRCASENTCPGCDLGIALAAHDALLRGE